MSESTTHTASRDLVWVSLVATLFLGIALGARDLWNPNEPTYGRVVVEMLERGDWLLPTLNGLPFVEKPILYYWLAAAAAAILGASETVLRLPALLASVVSTCLTYLLVRRHQGRATALTASALFVTTYLVWWTARTIQMDSFVLLTTVGVVYALTGAIDGRTSPTRAGLGAGVAAGFGFLGKGPVALVIPGLIVLAYVVLGRKPWRHLASGAVIGLGTLVVIAAPWYVALAVTGNSQALAEVLLRQNFERFVAAWDHDQPWWYYLKYIWIVFAPWSWLLPIAGAIRFDRRYPRDDEPAFLAWIGLLVPMVFFSLSDSKRAPYLLPAAPFVAWLGAVVVDHLRRGVLRRRERVACLGLGATLGAGLLTAAAYLTLRRSELEAVSEGVAIGLLLLLALSGSATLLAPLVPTTRRLSFRVLASSVAAIYLFMGCCLAPELNRVKSARSFMHQAQRAVRDGREIYSYFPEVSHLRGGYAFYRGQPLVDLATPNRLLSVWRVEQPCIVYENSLPPALDRRLAPVDEVLSRRVGSNHAHLICASEPLVPESR